LQFFQQLIQLRFHCAIGDGSGPTVLIIIVCEQGNSTGSYGWIFNEIIMGIDRLDYMRVNLILEGWISAPAAWCARQVITRVYVTEVCTPLSV